MKTGLILALTATLLDSTDAALEFGFCTETRNIGYLDLARYKGDWYEYTRDPVTPFSWGTSCVKANYGGTYSSGNDFSVSNKAEYPFGIPVESPGAGRCYPEDGECAISLRKDPPDLEKAPGYNVLHTDYDNYSVVYACRNYNVLEIPMRREDVWVLTREKGKLDPALYE